MATVKLKFRPSTIANKEGTLFFQVIHKRVVRQYSTEYKLFSDEWDESTSYITIPSSISEQRRQYLISLIPAISNDKKRINNIIRQFEISGIEYTSNMIVEKMSLINENGTFIAFGRVVSSRLKQLGKTRCSETYQSSLNSFERFIGKNDIPFEAIDSTLMQEFETYLRQSGICNNTSSYYMRNLRAIYNRAVDKDLTIQRYPFKHVYTGIDKTVKRAIPLKIMRQIKDLDLTLNPAMDFARDMFMFSFYTRGMSFIDMAYLKHTDLRNGILSYRRKKTNQQLFIRWEKPMQDIINKYDSTDSIFILPIIKRKDMDYRRQYINAAHFINQKLKKLGEQLNLSISLTSYVARHTWASIAKSKNISMSIISEAMGHDSESTTRIYLASLDSSIIDKANSIVFNSL
mgnify:CR=1 FL=1